VLRVYQPESSEADRQGLVQRSRPCDLCSGHDLEVISLTDRKGKPLPTAICIDCGLISHLQLPTDDESERYYRDEYRMAYHAEETPSPRRVIKAWEQGQFLLNLLKPFLHQGEKVFEVGAGLGCNVKAFLLAGFPASGIEPGASFCTYSRDTLHVPLTTGRLEQLPQQPSHDLVLLVHVIEHLNSPRTALQQIRGLLNPGGRLYVECPNTSAPHAAPGKMFHYAHNYNFTDQTLISLATSCGLKLTQRLSKPRDKNLRLLFETSEASQPLLQGDGYEHTMSCVERYRRFTYHMRPSYVIERARSLRREIACRIRSQEKLDKIIAACQTAPAVVERHPEPPTLTKAA